VIDVEHLSKIYHLGEQRVAALDDVSFHLEAGEFAAIMGPSGSGKSTLMNLLGCLDRPTSGSYRLEGVDVKDLGANQLADLRNQRIGFVFQNFNLLPRASALENVELPLLYGRVRGSRDLAQAALKRVGLGDRARHKPAELSGGERQRVAIARAIVNNPAIILADEPTGNLDSATGNDIMDIFRRLNEQGVLILLVTHEAEIAEYAERVISMRDGHIERDHAREGAVC